MHELGGNVIEALSDTRKKEEPEDVVSVLEGYCHAIMVRTHSDDDLRSYGPSLNDPDHQWPFRSSSPVPNPCRSFNFKGSIWDIERISKSTYVGDGNNILHSLLIAGSSDGHPSALLLPTDMSAQ